MLVRRAAPGVREGVDVVVGVVETHGRAETEALLDGLETIPRRDASTTRAACSTEMDLDAILARRPRLVLVDELAHTNAPGQPPSQALSGCRGAARRRHRRLHHAQHPACRKPERRRRPDHPHPGARDRAGLDPRPRRRDRAGRPHAGRPDPAAEGGQGLCAGAGRARGAALFLARQSDRAARAGAAPHRPAGRRADGRLTCAPTRSPGRGRPASACWSASATTGPATRRRCAMRGGWPTGCARPGRRSMSRPRARSGSTRRSATASPRRCAWPSASAARPSPCPATTWPRASLDYARANNFTHIVIAKIARARAGASCCAARSRNG